MKNNSSRKLLITSLVVAFFSLLLGLITNLLTGDENFINWLKTSGVDTKTLVIGVIVIVIALLLLSYLQFKYSQDSKSDDVPLNVNIEFDIKRLFDSLKNRYQTRYESKLDGRFEITLEVSDNFDSQNPRSIFEQFGENASKGEAIKIIS